MRRQYSAHGPAGLTCSLRLALFAALAACFTGCDNNNHGNGGAPAMPPAASNDATLSTLTISDGSLAPAFSANTNAYTVTVGNAVSEITVGLTTSDSGATVTVEGTAVASGSAGATINLPVGDTVVNVVVTAADGTTTRTYTITVTRQPAPGPSSDATLADLVLSAAALDQIFQSSSTSYTATVNFATTSTTVTATTSDAAATLTINGVATASGAASGAINLNEGANTITVAVTAEDGTTTSSYTIEVTRQAAGNFAQQAYLKASNPDADDEFGFGAAISGDTLVVGAPFADGANNSQVDAGAAYVFFRDAGVWMQQAILTASNAEAGDQFGYSVDIDGDTIVVGAPMEDVAAGAAYVFTRTGNAWSEQAYLKASNAESGDFFGYRVAISGDTVAATAPQESSDAFDPNNNFRQFSGAAYAFTRSGSAWSQQALIKASNVGTSDRFGDSLDLSGDVMVVGSVYEASDGSSEANNSVDRAGAAYVFRRTSGAWAQEAYLKAVSPDPIDFFGIAVAVSGNTIVVTVPSDDSSLAGGGTDNNLEGSGGAFVFVDQGGGSWALQAYLKPDDAVTQQAFGSAAALEGDTLVVSAAFMIVGGLPEVGGAYVFSRTGSDWNQVASLQASNAGSRDQFGFQVAISNGTILATARNEDGNGSGGEADNSLSDAGAAYVFE
jgi:Cadherin-like beta sandwich domain/FG-GAP repeat